MSERFEVGEVCDYLSVNGIVEVTVVSALLFGETMKETTQEINPPHFYYFVASPIWGKPKNPLYSHWAADAKKLRKKRPPQQFEAGDWSQCIFTPKQLVKKESTPCATQA